jgi:hypothetical protein
MWPTGLNAAASPHLQRLLERRADATPEDASKQLEAARQEVAKLQATLREISDSGGQDEVGRAAGRRAGRCVHGG